MVLAVAFLFVAAMLAAGQATPDEAAAQGWRPPTPEAIGEALGSARAELEGTSDQDPPVLRAELERLVSILGRQNVLVDELNTPHDAHDVAAEPGEGPITVQQLDELRSELEATRSSADAAASRISESQRSVEESLAKIADAERALRTAKETDPEGVGEAARIAAMRLRTARAELDVRRTERRIAERESASAESRATALASRIELSRDRVVFTKADLDDVLAGLDRTRQDLESQLSRAQSNLDFASERLMSARRRLDEQGRETPGLVDELGARVLWRDTYRRESETVAKAIERVGLRRELWEMRFGLANDTEYRRSGRAADRIREISGEIERSRRLLLPRLDEARAQLDKLSGSDSDRSESTTAIASRWSEESRRAAAQLVDVLDQDRRRLDNLDRLVSLAAADASTIRARSIGDWLREAWGVSTGLWGTELFVVQERSITVGRMVTGIALLLVGLWLSRAASTVLGRIILPRIGLNEGATAAVQALIFYALLVTIALFALRLINIPLTVFTVLGGALAIGIGFGSQNLMNNFISGLIILAERPVRVGDLIEVGDLHGIVQHIGARSTRVLTPNNIDIIVPNSSFLESNVTNWTLTEDRVRSSVSVGVAYGLPTRDVMKLMKKAADDHGKVLEKPAPIVLFEDFGDNALLFTLVFWIRMRRMMDRRIVESDLRLRINELFKDAGITIAFPQRDIHLDTLSPLQVRIADRESDGQIPAKEPHA